MTISRRPPTRRSQVRLLPWPEFRAAAAFCASRGPDGVMAGHRIRQAASAAAPYGEVWVVERRGARRLGQALAPDHIEALAWAYGNLIPVGADLGGARAFAALARARGARYSSVVGEADAVQTIWSELEPMWPPARSVRLVQPCLALKGPALVAPDPMACTATLASLDALVPASRAMFTEELGFPPPGPEASYRAHVATQVERGRVIARLDPADGSVVFKAELGAECGSWVQVQGVWTDPAWRGRGLAKAGMAAVAAEARRRGIPNICLYVNDFNAPALAVYRAVGFTRVSTWATVML